MSNHSTSRGPGIRCPPPFYFLGAGLAAWALGWLRPLAFDAGGRSPGQEVVGWVLLAVGFWMFGWGLSTLVRQRTTFLPDRDANRLVITGPYQHSRNPMYVGMTSTYAGVGLLANSGWALLLLPFVLIFVSARVIGREERYLRRRFGDDYAEYSHRVRRWL